MKPSYSGLIDQNACKPTKDDHQAELCISWRAAKAAEEQAFWAEAGCWVGAFGIIFIVVTLHYTRKAAESAQVSARAAERAVEESSRALDHARSVADSDLRPWITIEANLDGPIEMLNPMGFPEGDNLAFFVRLHARNVGKTAAQNVIYWISGADFRETVDANEWLNKAISAAISASRNCLSPGWGSTRDFDTYNDSLAPSESHESRKRCIIGISPPDERPHWKAYELCVCIVAAYTGMGAGDDPFYTAKVFPIGFLDVPVFQKFIGPNRLPIGVGDVAFGPVRKAKSS